MSTKDSKTDKPCTIHSVSGSDYRVEEYDGTFKIQVRTTEHKTKGHLWWKKKIEVEKWEYVNKYGKPVWCIYYPIYYKEQPIAPFKDLKSAFDKVDIMIKGKIYHYR